MKGFQHPKLLNILLFFAANIMDRTVPRNLVTDTNTLTKFRENLYLAINLSIKPLSRRNLGNYALKI